LKTLKYRQIAAAVLAVLLILLGVIYYYAILHIVPAKQTIGRQPDNRYDDTLVVVADIDYKPFSFYDANGRPGGYDIEFIHLVAEKMRMNVDIRLMPWTDCMSAITRGEANVILGLNYEAGESSGMLHSVVTSNDIFVCFGRKNFSDIADLYNKKLATIEKSGCIMKFLRPYQLMENTVFYPTYTEALHSVLRGENDYAIIRYSVGREILAGLDGRDIRAVGPFVTTCSACVGLSADSGHLLDAMNRAIRELKQDGTIKRLTDKWLGRYVESLSFRDFVRVFDWVIIAAGLMLLTLVALVFYIYHANHAKILQKKELELTQGRISVMLSQIRPHFLYNSLSAIRELCLIDPQVASQTVDEFAMYLRGNLDSLSITKPIPLDRELEHVETYLALEKKRFGDKLHIVHDITARDFLLPALTLQPLVENAVRHGVTKRTMGGTVTISTVETETDYVAVVSDNGIGFDPRETIQDGRNHVGIDNIRSRLASMCGGTLTIQSEPGIGTTAVIAIPKGIVDTCAS